MDGFATLGIHWQTISATSLLLVGLLFTWRGLFGGPSGGYGLLRREMPMFGRLLGWRIFLYGLTLSGVGAAWLWEAKWLLVLSLGFGFVEMQEATGVIKAWRWDGGGSAARRARPAADRSPVHLGGPTGIADRYSKDGTSRSISTSTTTGRLSRQASS